MEQPGPCFIDELKGDKTYAVRSYQQQEYAFALLLVHIGKCHASTNTLDHFFQKILSLHLECGFIFDKNIPIGQAELLLITQICPSSLGNSMEMTFHYFLPSFSNPPHPLQLQNFPSFPSKYQPVWPSSHFQGQTSLAKYCHLLWHCRNYQNV